MVRPPGMPEGATANEARFGWLSDDHETEHAHRFLAGLAPVLIVGFGLVVIGAFLAQLQETQGGEGLGTTASWFSWIGRAVVGVVLVGAALRGRASTDGVRVGILALGTLVLFGLVNGLGPFLDALLGR